MTRFFGHMHPRCQITPTRRSLWLRIRRAVALAWLRWEIDSAEEWIEQCARGGIHDGKGLRELRRHVAALRVRLSLWSSMNELTEQKPTPLAGPMALLQSGVELDKLERLWAMQVAYEAREAEKAYNSAFAAFKDEAVKIVKNRHVTDGPLKGKSYAELFSVVNAVTPALSKHGLSASWKLTKDEKDWIEVTCILKHQLGHSEIVSMGGPPDVGGAKNAIMARASTISYLERYTLKAICGLAEQGDDDDAGNGRRDVDAAPEDDPLVEQGQAQSMEGTKALTAWWAGLKEADRKRLTPHFGPMKRAAAAADKDRR